MSKTTNALSPDLRARTVRLALDNEAQHASRWQAGLSISVKIGCAPRTLNEGVKRADPAPLSDRTRRNAALRPEIERILKENWRVYGVRKVWRQMVREGVGVARCTVARLMKGMGLAGIIRGKPHNTAVPDKKAPCLLDKANRQVRVPGVCQIFCV